jgi:phosphomevalonate kinase
MATDTEWEEILRRCSETVGIVCDAKGVTDTHSLVIVLDHNTQTVHVGADCCCAMHTLELVERCAALMRAQLNPTTTTH